MERLNEIINRAAQRRQPSGHDKSSPYNTPPQGPRPGAAPARRPLPEQTARLGQYTPPPGAVNRVPAPPPRSTQGDVVTRTPRSSPDQASYVQGNRLEPERPHTGGRPQGSPLHHGQTYRPALHPVPQGDVQEEWAGEWEEDTAQIRYGDWENGVYDESASSREASDAPMFNRASARIAQTYPRNQSSMITRELRSQVDAESELSMTPHSREARLPAPLASPLPPPRAGQTQRLTQPLNRSTSIARMNQESSSASLPARQQGNREHDVPAIPAPYATGVALCPICKGAGYLRANVPYGHPNFGKPIACECKEAERMAKRRLYLQGVSNLGELQDKNFENFNANTSRSTYNAYHEALDYARDPYGWLVFIGKVGCGKTHLAAAIANRLLARGSLVLFSTVSDLLDHLRATFMPSSTEVYDQLFQKMREAALLVLDDLGAQQSSPWANEKLFQLLNYRYNSRIPTIITTNNVGLQGVEERIRSRMTDTSLVTRVTFEDAIDYRQRNPRRE